MLSVLAALALSQMNLYVNGSVSSPLIDGGEVVTSTIGCTTPDSGLSIYLGQVLTEKVDSAGELLGVHFRNALISPRPNSFPQGVMSAMAVVDGGTDTAGILNGFAVGGGDADGGVPVGAPLFILCPGTPYAASSSFFNCMVEPYGQTTIGTFGNNVIAMTDGGCAEGYVAGRVGGGVLIGNNFQWSYICMGY